MYTYIPFHTQVNIKSGSAKKLNPGATIQHELCQAEWCPKATTELIFLNFDLIKHTWNTHRNVIIVFKLNTNHYFFLLI